MNWEEVFGYFSPMHQEEYNRLVSLSPNKSHIAEVGSFRGKSLCSIAPTIKKKKLQVVAVDLFDNVTYTYNEGNVLDHKTGMLDDFKKNIDAFGLTPYVEVVQWSSVLSAQYFKDNFFSFVFIDAAHDYESVKEDIDAWWPKVEKGGILSGHDYGEPWPGVCKAVSGKFDIYHVKNEIWSVRK